MFTHCLCLSQIRKLDYNNSTVNGVPSLGLSYDRKFQNVYKSIQRIYCIYSVCIEDGKMAEEKAQGKKRVRHEEDIRLVAVFI